MQQQYYTLPLDANALIKNESIDTCTIKDSIANHLHLLMISSFGECHFDPTFGCAIWDVDFNNVANDTKLVLIIKDSLYNSLKNHEKRLSKIDITVKIQQEERSAIKAVSRVKKRVVVVINATIKKTNERFTFQEGFFIGPLSFK